MRTWILQRWQVYARVMLGLGVFLSPVLFHRGTQDVFNLLKLTILWVCGVASMALYVAWAAERGVWFPRFNIGLAAGAFIFTCILATIFSKNPLLSLVGLYHRYGGLIPFLLYAAIMLLIVGLYWEKPLEMRDIAKASAWASAALMAYVLIQAAGQDWIAWKDASGGPPPYPVGTMGNSNFAGGYLGIAVPFLVYVAATAKKESHRLILYIVCGLDLLALWFTQTRGGMIAGAAGLLTMAFMYRDRLPRWMRPMPYATIAVGVLIAFVVLWHPGSERPYGPFARIDTFRTGTFDVRTYYWGTALRIFKENPVLGVGLDLYYANYPLHRLPEDGAQLGLTITDKPHNVFLEYLANGGVVAFGAYAVMVGFALYYGFSRQRKLPQDQRFLLVAFMSVLVGYLAQGFFSIDVPPLAVMAWIGLGGVATLSDPKVVKARDELIENPPKTRQRKKAARPSGPVIRRHGPTLWPVHGSLLGFTALAVVLGVQPVRADVAAKQAITAQSVESAQQRAEVEYEKAIKRNPLEASYRAQAGTWAEARASQAKDPEVKKKLFEEALDLFQQALDMQPGNVFYMMNLARLYTTWSEQVDPALFPQADKWWTRVVTHDPTDWDVHNRYALMLNSWANATGDRNTRLKTADRLKEVVRIKPDYVAAWINLGKIYLNVGDSESALRAVEAALSLEPSNTEAKSLLASLQTGTGS